MSKYFYAFIVCTLVYCANQTYGFDLVYDFESPTYSLGSLYDPNLVGQDGWIRSGAQTATIVDSSGSYPVLSGNQSLYHYGSGYSVQDFNGKAYVFDEVIEFSAIVTLEYKGSGSNYFNLLMKADPYVSGAPYVQLVGQDPSGDIANDAYFQVETVGGRVTVDTLTFNQGDILNVRMVIDYGTGDYEVLVSVNSAAEVSLGTFDFAFPVTRKEASNGLFSVRTRSGGIVDNIVLGNMGQCTDATIQSDLNFDCVVNIDDFAIMASEWLTNSLVE